jgi:hypothetical protein
VKTQASRAMARLRTALADSAAAPGAGDRS